MEASVWVVASVIKWGGREVDDVDGVDVEIWRVTVDVQRDVGVFIMAVVVMVDDVDDVVVKVGLVDMERVEVDGVGMRMIGNGRGGWSRLLTALLTGFFPFLSEAPDNNTYLAFIDCQLCEVIHWASANSHSLLPVTG